MPLRNIAKDLALALVLGVSAFFFQRHEDSLPRHLQVWVGTTKVSDYWTTNRYQVNRQATNVLTATGFKTEILCVTNQLW